MDEASPDDSENYALLVHRLASYIFMIALLDLFALPLRMASSRSIYLMLSLSSTSTASPKTDSKLN